MHYTQSCLSARNGHLGVAKLLLEHGADINAKNDVGETPYLLSILSGSQRFDEILL
jgi:ankyrin repeat protein